MTAELFLKDPYLKSFEARILHLDGREAVLDRTAFYPGGGGQPADKGRLKTGPVEAAVVDVRRGESGIVHVLDRRIPRTVERIGGKLDWDRRYTHMRYRTALHVLSGVVRKSLGAKATGGRIRAGGARLDFFLPGELTAEIARKIERRTSATLSAGHPVLVYGADREEDWVVEVAGIEARTDGGTHVANTQEVGEMELTGHEDKGREKKRLEFVLI